MEQARIAGSQGGQGTQGTQSTRGKPQAQQPSGAVDPNAQGGFLALLASLEDTQQSNVTPSDSAVDPSLLHVDPASLAAWQGLLAPGERPPVTAVASSAAAAGGVGVPFLETSIADGLVAQTAMLDSAAEAAAAKPAASAVAGISRMFSRLQNAAARGVEGPSSVAVAAAGASRAEMKQAPEMVAFVTQGPQAVVESHMVGRPMAHARSLDGSEWQGGQVGAAGGPVLEAFAESRVPQRGSGAASSDAGGRSSGDAALGEWGTLHAGPETAGMEGAAAFSDPMQAGLEEQIADQVAYWVNQKTQNAEMTLDRDGQPVQVTVSLSGSEAHVTFRSDQAQTRELLDSSMSQLRDLLHNEGLVLSGSSVEASTRDGASPNDSGQRQGREGEQRARVVASVPSAVGAARRHGAATDRAVDIFV